MKKILLPLLTVQSISIFGQIATVTRNEATVPDKNLKSIELYDAGLSNVLYVHSSSGVTIFDGKDEIRIIDTKTMSEKKKVEMPKYKKYDYILYSDNSYSALKGNFLTFYRKKDEINKKLTNVYFTKIEENLMPQQEPTYLFSAQDPERWDEVYDKDWGRFYVNDAKSLGMFAYICKNKKQNQRVFYCRLFDGNMKQVKADSIVDEYKTSNKCSAIVFDNGAAITKTSDTKCEVTILDAKSNKSYKISIDGKDKAMVVDKIKTLSTGKMILCGHYTGKSFGMFKITYNPTKQSIDEEIDFDHVSQGKLESDTKIVRDALITENGTCYMHFLQASSFSESGGFVTPRKWEIKGISDKGEKWRRQIPTSAGLDMMLSGENLEIVYPYEDKQSYVEKINYNNYVWTPWPDPVFLPGVGVNHNENFNTTILKMTPNGTTTAQYVAKIGCHPVIGYNGEMIGVQKHTTNSTNTFKTEFITFIFAK